MLPELNGKLDGVSIRVPTPNVSCIDFKFVAKHKTDEEEINQSVSRRDNGRPEGRPLSFVPPSSPLLDLFVGAHQDTRRNGDADRPGGAEVEGIDELSGLFDRQVSRRGALQDAIDIARRSHE